MIWWEKEEERKKYDGGMNYRIELCPSKENYAQVKRIMHEKIELCPSKKNYARERDLWSSKENYAQVKRIMLK